MAAAYAAAAACHKQRSGEGTRLSKDLRINEMIRVPNVRVVDEEGSQLGVMPTFQALQTAQERGYDLVEVAPTAAAGAASAMPYNARFDDVTVSFGTQKAPTS